MADEALTAGAVARRLGVAVTTLRTWHQRYGLGPSHHVPGQHRRYTPEDMARLQVMRRLTAQGVSPAEAAAWARRVPVPIDVTTPGATEPAGQDARPGQASPQGSPRENPVGDVGDVQPDGDLPARAESRTAGPIDAGPIAGPIDAGPIDAGPIDAGPIDAGPPSGNLSASAPGGSTGRYRSDDQAAPGGQVPAGGLKRPGRDDPAGASASGGQSGGNGPGDLSGPSIAGDRPDRRASGTADPGTRVAAGPASIGEQPSSRTHDPAAEHPDQRPLTGPSRDPEHPDQRPLTEPSRDAQHPDRRGRDDAGAAPHVAGDTSPHPPGSQAARPDVWPSGSAGAPSEGDAAQPTDRSPPGSRPAAEGDGEHSSNGRSAPAAAGRPDAESTSPFSRAGEVRPAIDAVWPERNGRMFLARDGGGHAIPTGRAGPAARGLARAAMRLDGPALREILEMTVTDRGVVAAWEEVIMPVLIGVGERYAATKRFIEVEHMLSRVVTEVLGSVTRPPSSQIPRVLLTATDEEQHTLALEALAAALAQAGVASRLLGARVPARALEDAISRTGPAVLVLWSQLPGTADPAQWSHVLTHRHRPLLVAAAGPGWRMEQLPEGVTPLRSLGEAVRQVSAVAVPADRPR